VISGKWFDMNKRKNYKNKYNLLNAFDYEDVSENTLLFSIENYLLEKNDVKIKDMDNYIKLLKNDEGLYNNIIGIPVHDKDKWTSHDQLLSIIAFSLIQSKKYHLEIWKWLKSHLFTYDNISKKINFKRFLHPRDIIFFGYCANSKLCKLLLPLLTIIMCISCFNKQSSGKLLCWVRCKCANLKITYYLCTLIIKLNKNYGSWNKVFNTYFPNKNHPNHIGD
jgi:hypothetical protein